MENMKEITAIKILPSQVLPLRAKVLRPNHPLMDCVFESDHAASAGHFGVFSSAEEIISVGTIYPELIPHDYIRLLDETDVQFWRLRGMATDEAARGQGAGAAILHACIEHVRKHRQPNRKALIWAHARTGAIKFYQRNGFEAVGEEYNLPPIGPHFLIILEP
jgi:GNAT superfamily N-acetyltransferase